MIPQEIHSSASSLSAGSRWVFWSPVFLGLAALYLPTYFGLTNTVWSGDESVHGPIVLMIILWLFWHKRADFFQAQDKPSTGSGSVFLVVGLLLYILGRSQDILIFEVGSQVPVLIGTVLICRGKAALKPYLFPILFLVFLVPLPGFLVDALTTALKHQVSDVVEHTLYWLGYPIARSGVTLVIGPYQLLVADACSGINSMFSLSAIGILYIYLKGKQSLLHNGLLLASILPIAFMANIGRVIALTLITFYFGDNAGQEFVHDFAAIAEFVIAMLILFLTDYVLGLIIVRRRRHVSS